MATAQLQVLNKILESKDLSIITLNNLTKEHFSDYPSEYAFILNHYNTYHQVPDKLTFASQFKDFDFVEVNEPDSYLLGELFTDYNRNVMAAGFNDIRALLMSDRIDDAKVLYETSINKLQHGSAMSCTSLWDSDDRYTHYIERANNISDTYISTGLTELDKLIGGIDCENENLVIAARTGVGKSWMMVKLAVEAAWQGKDVGIYEGEMTADKIGYRIDTIMAQKLGVKLSNKGITRGELFDKADYDKYLDQLRLHRMHHKLGSIKVLTPADIAGPATVDALRAFIEKEKLQMLFVDQYSLLEDTSHAKQLFERVGNISKAIKNLQVMKKIPIISVSQMNRTKNEDDEQDTTQIGLADRIGQDATVILMLAKEIDPNDETKFFMTVNVVKARDGGDNRKLKYAVDLNYGEFKYIPKENDKTKSPEEFQAMEEEYQMDNQPW